MGMGRGIHTSGTSREVWGQPGVGEGAQEHGEATRGRAGKIRAPMGRDGKAMLRMWHQLCRQGNFRLQGEQTLGKT